ncbi:MAG: GH3 auxin-responsive promoter family protein, partial [Bacteroidetes bacterium]|nr:GH3 auxin-responsive promoter family protein [Bacteroidota bacterium]
MPILGSILKQAVELKAKLPEKQADGWKLQKQVLKRILRKASVTSFGEYYNFNKILKQKDFVKAFQNTVPTHDYNAIFRKWWYRTLAGEPYVCWPGKVKYFALSSGTSEASSKQIPVTADMLRAIKRTSIKQIMSMAYYDFPKNFYEKGMLALGGSTHLTYNGTYYEGDLSGITAGAIPFWFQHFYKPGKRISKERDWTTKLDEIVRNAGKWDIGIIVGVPAWIQILLERIIEHYNVKNIHDVWPNLRVYCHSGVSFAPYVKGFEKLLGKPLIYIETYLASEGFIAYQKKAESSSMDMILGNGLFYEFVPFTDKNFDEEGNLIENPEVLALNQIENNKEYALLLTNVAGAYRYLVGDTIKFTNKDKHQILITGRTKHFLSICGEHLSQENMNRAIELTEADMNINIREFTVCGVRHGSLFAHKWYIGTEDEADPVFIANTIDEHLKVLNDDYRV